MDIGGHHNVGISHQTTLKNRISCAGIGLHSGRTINMCLRPAEADTGILFKRTDVTSGSQFIAAHFDKVADTMLGTTVRNSDGVEVATIEHLMAALSGCEIDNVLIELDGPEIPVMDGSAAPFVFLIECADKQKLAKPRQAIKVLKTVRIETNGAVAQLSPADRFELKMDIEFESTAIKQQSYELEMTSDSFKYDISRARTFGFLEQVEFMQKNGRALGGSLDNAVVIDRGEILNAEGLRYQDEFVRHKMLDAIGDLFLAGAPIQGRFEGVKSGHGINNQLLRALFEDRDAWMLVDMPDTEDQTLSDEDFYEQPALAQTA